MKQYLYRFETEANETYYIVSTSLKLAQAKLKISAWCVKEYELNKDWVK